MHFPIYLQVNIMALYIYDTAWPDKNVVRCQTEEGFVSKSLSWYFWGSLEL